MRAISKNTRRATAVTLAAAMAVAVYLNWQYARDGLDLGGEALTVAATMSESEPVLSGAITDELMTEAEAVSSTAKNYGEAQLVSVASDTGAKFFEQARLKREKSHDEAMDTIQKSLRSAALTEEDKKAYAAQMKQNLEDLNAENEIETLVRAKGFADCLCFLQPGRADLNGYDFRRRTDGCTGGPDPGYRFEQDAALCAKYNRGGSEVNLIRCCENAKEMV